MTIEIFKEGDTMLCDMDKKATNDLCKFIISTFKLNEIQAKTYIARMIEENFSLNDFEESYKHVLDNYEYSYNGGIPCSAFLNYKASDVKFYTYEQVLEKNGGILSGFKAVKIKGVSNHQKNKENSKEVPYWVSECDFNINYMMDWIKYLGKEKK